MSGLEFIRDTSAPGRVTARVGRRLVGEFDNYRLTCHIGSAEDGRVCYDGHYMLSEDTWRLKVWNTYGRV